MCIKLLNKPINRFLLLILSILNGSNLVEKRIDIFFNFSKKRIDVKWKVSFLAETGRVHIFTEFKTLMISNNSF